MVDYSKEKGVWRTIRGRRVFIKDGESLSDAMKNSGKFDNEKNTGKSTRAEVKEKIQKHIRDYYENDEDLVRDMDAAADPRYDVTPWQKGSRLVEGGNFLIANEDMSNELNSWGINPNGKKFSEDKSYNTYKSLMGREMGKIYEQQKEYELYKKGYEHPESIDPMTENSTDWVKLSKKYSKRYENL